MNNNWEQLAMGQAEIISDLSLLCKDLIRELAMYRETDKEEEKARNILKGGNIEPGSGDNITYAG